MEEGNTTQSRGRRRRIVVVLAVCVLVGIGVVAFWPGEREPEYNGKKLSEWVQPYTWHYDDIESDNGLILRERKAADDAMRHMGTNALHWLVRWIAYEQPVWKTKIRRIAWNSAVKPIRDWCFKDDRLRGAASCAFVALGTNAAAVVPELVQVVKTSHYAEIRHAAIRALGYMGKDGYPCLMEALDDRKTSYEGAVSILQMAKTGVDVSSAIPRLLLVDREIYKFQTANPGFEHYYFVPHLDQSLSNVIPSLTNCLQHTNHDVRVQAATALGWLHERASPAVPALKEALDDRETAVREAAITALREIAPEVLTNGVKDF